VDTQTAFRAIRAYASRGKHIPERVRVLVVDDDANVRAFVERALRTAGYVTASARSGHDALALARTTSGGFELVVTDVRMPHMSGPQLIERLRHRERDVKVLYLTGYNDQLFTEKTGLWEDEAFLDKPCTVRALTEAVSLLLNGHLPPSSGPA
jgi:two-component system cell cycle sensor histidine kinase/response regulator CckA